MKHSDFNNFKVFLTLNIEIDANMRRIAEKIKLLSQLQAVESLSEVSKFLAETDSAIDSLISLNHCSDEPEK